MKSTRFRSFIFRWLVVGVFLAGVSWAQDRSHVVVKASKHAVAPPLSETVPLRPLQTVRLGLLPGDDDDTVSMRRPRFSGLVQDSALQASSATTFSAAGLSPLSTNSGLNILGLGLGFPGFNVSANIPDTNGAAGPTQFVQFVNESFAVFNKSNGNLLYGPAHGNTVWQALGGGCAANPNLDEIVQYDQQANRWVMMMPDFYNPNYLCIAVSTTSDAVNGGWNLYAFRPPLNTTLCNCRMMTDYPKLSVWPDGYYLSYSQIWNGNYEGQAACAFDRNSMLQGNAATMQCFLNTGTSYGSMLPADLDGATAPPAGSPEYFLNFDGNDQSLDLWQFHVDWTNPANSTFTGPINTAVAAFTEACGETVVEFNYTNAFACIPQKGTSVTLDSYGDRLMYRLAYRNFGGYQSLVTNHTVTTGTNGSQTGVRWYELRNTGSGFGLYQQGTYAPDSSYRWMGSMAMDQAGNIAMGYSVSSATMSPSIRYTGRASSDPLGQMGGEVDILSQAGVTPGSRLNNYRWADYSSLAIDPTDDCTFWFTTEYMPNNGNYWSTRIASFSFPSCTGSNTLVVKEVGSGTVASTDGTIKCTNGSGTCSALYPNGTSVTMNATAASGWAFSGWSGSCTGGNPCTVVVNGNMSSTATFTPVQTYTLTVNEVGQGTVTSTDGVINCTNGSGTCSAVYASGRPVTLNATGASGWTFSGWSGSCSGGNPCNVVMNGNLGVTATCTSAPSWAIVHKASVGGNITSLTVPATGTGNLIAVAFMFNGNTSISSVSDTAGNTYVSAGAQCARNNNSVEIWYAVSSNPGATVITPSFAGSPTYVQIASWEVSGVLSVVPDAKGTASGSVTLNNTPGAAVTTTQAGDFILSVLLALNTNFTSISSGNEFTNDFKTNGNGWAHITSNSASIGAHQASWYTASPTGAYCASTVAFAP
ncbi:MAG TPA: hypothetical protein VMQ17_14295 [Candidatus Sulfotelmatobacter sp.]|nr:hypothetical protein [Candidatus Sulfotelmatobacter sp.]